MPAREINDPKHWHDRAAEMRVLVGNHERPQSTINNAQVGRRLRQTRGARCYSCCRSTTPIEMNHKKDDDLALAASHVAQGQIVVARQRERIER
jgi:hypothetical protein